MNPVEKHYTHGSLQPTILAALESAGKNLKALSIDDLAPIDEFHIRGREATEELASALQITESMKVLDVGSGLGGASRYIAHKYGCHIAGIDITEEYCAVARTLSQLLGLDKLTKYKVATALELPYRDNEFDIVWTQHASMNIADKQKLFSEMFRVLRPGGRLALYDVVKGSGEEIIFPVPWACDSSTSFLDSAADLREHIGLSGLDIKSWKDVTSQGRVWFEERVAAIKDKGQSPLGYHILLGEAFQEMAKSQLINLHESRIGLMQVIAEKP